MWKSQEPNADGYIPRITTRKKHRVKRIETLGNGQVPLCAAVAFVWCFEILRGLSKGMKVVCVCKTKEGE